MSEEARMVAMWDTYPSAFIESFDWVSKRLLWGWQLRARAGGHGPFHRGEIPKAEDFEVT